MILGSIPSICEAKIFANTLQSIFIRCIGWKLAGSDASLYFWGISHIRASLKVSGSVPESNASKYSLVNIGLNTSIYFL